MAAGDSTGSGRRSCPLSALRTRWTTSATRRASAQRVCPGVPGKRALAHRLAHGIVHAYQHPRAARPRTRACLAKTRGRRAAVGGCDALRPGLPGTAGSSVIFMGSSRPLTGGHAIVHGVALARLRPRARALAHARLACSCSTVCCISQQCFAYLARPTVSNRSLCAGQAR